MNIVYDHAAAYPTVIFTVLLGIVLIYWLVAIIGLIGIDTFDLPEAEGSSFIAEGLSSLLYKFGLNGVPLTVVISFLSLFGWIISYYLSTFLLGPTSALWLVVLLGSIIFIISTVGGLIGASLLCLPLKPVFKNAKSPSANDYVGQTVLVRTSSVTPTFGEAVLEDGGAGQIVQVRSSGTEEYQRHDKVVLIDYSQETGSYLVVSESEFLGTH